MLRWRLFGISFCIEPSFWLMNALWAMLMAGPLTGNAAQDRGLLVFILVWIGCTFVSVMVHELGHVITGRIFGQPGAITLTGLGGQAVGGYEELSPWQRILVIFMGPCAGFAFVTLILLFDGRPWNQFLTHMQMLSEWNFLESLKVETFWVQHTPMMEWRGRNHPYFIPYTISISILTFINMFVNILNLFPIIPMDGGMIMKEICTLLSPQKGLKIAFGISLVLALGMTLFYLELVLEKYGFLASRVEAFYPFGFPEFSLIVFGMMAYQCWSTYSQLSTMERHSLYRQRDDD